MFWGMTGKASGLALCYDKSQNVHAPVKYFSPSKAVTRLRYFAIDS